MQNQAVLRFVASQMTTKMEAWQLIGYVVVVLAIFSGQDEVLSGGLAPRGLWLISFVVACKRAVRTFLVSYKGNCVELCPMRALG